MRCDETRVPSAVWTVTTGLSTAGVLMFARMPMIFLSSLFDCVVLGGFDSGVLVMSEMRRMMLNRVRMMVSDFFIRWR